MGNGGESRTDIRGRLRAAQRVTFLQQRGDIRGERRLGGIGRGQHHRGQPGMRPQRGHPAAGCGDAPLRIERAEFYQQRTGRRQCPLRRWIEERQRRGRRAPGRAVEHQRRQLRLQDFRPIEWRHSAMQRG